MAHSTESQKLEYVSTKLEDAYTSTAKLFGIGSKTLHEYDIPDIHFGVPDKFRELIENDDVPIAAKQYFGERSFYDRTHHHIYINSLTHYEFGKIAAQTLYHQIYPTFFEKSVETNDEFHSFGILSLISFVWHYSGLVKDNDVGSHPDSEVVDELITTLPENDHTELLLAHLLPSSRGMVAAEEFYCRGKGEDFEELIHQPLLDARVDIYDVTGVDIMAEVVF